jgi:hypothetical protein
MRKQRKEEEKKGKKNQAGTGLAGGGNLILWDQICLLVGSSEAPHSYTCTILSLLNINRNL